MWLNPFFSGIADVATRVYFRRRFAGGRVPPAGPCLLVANHPNSLLDPAMVVAVAGRPVRFLAKSTLFTDSPLRHLIRGVGSIPVYRAQDDPAQMARNDDTFRAVREVLLQGGAVGIFPEGISHNDPALAPLKTGAARIALGTAARLESPFPIVPVGLTFRDKDVFRSEALAVVGAPVHWEDLAARGEADVEAVRELTARIDAALRAATVNLERWEDAPVVECAQAIFAAEHGADPDPASQIARTREAADLLARLRREGREDWIALYRDVGRHTRLLRRLRLAPADLYVDTGGGTALRWLVRRIPLLGLIPVGASFLGTALFWPPYRMAGWIADHSGAERDVRSTYKLVGGIVTFAGWIGLLAVAAALAWGWEAGLAAVLALPVVALLTLGMHERMASAWLDTRRFFLLKRRGELRENLVRQQKELHRRLVDLYERERGPIGAAS